MSAHLPGVMLPISWSMRKQVATLIVTYWIALMGSSPSLMAQRTMWSRWPSLMSVSGCVSSEIRQAKRSSILLSSTALMMTGISCQALP